MIWALRISFWLQALLGLGLSRGLAGLRPLGVPSGEGDSHMALGLIAAILAVVVLRPVAGVPDDALGTAARFFPIVPLLIGLAIRFGGYGGVPVVVVHVLLGIIAVGLVEMALARRRRALRTAGAAAPVSEA